MSNKEPETYPFFQTGPIDPLGAVFGAWRLWLLAAFLGALLAWAVYGFSPADYRARATVVVDQNLEEAWEYFPDRQLFQFQRRETARLVELAWSDTVLARVADVSPELAIADLRGGFLKLSQPADGGWHFYAEHADAELAQRMAMAWVEAFVAEARLAADASPELEGARAELNELLKGTGKVDAEQIAALSQRIMELAERSKGVSLYVELYVSQAAELPLARSVSLGSYLLAGSVGGAALAVLFKTAAIKKTS